MLGMLKGTCHRKWFYNLMLVWGLRDTLFAMLVSIGHWMMRLEVLLWFLRPKLRGEPFVTVANLGLSETLGIAAGRALSFTNASKESRQVQPNTETNTSSEEKQPGNL
eukprot:2435260-Amphidinium_carterae.1